MTGEDLIIEAAAHILSRSCGDAHVALRRAFWIASRCEHCGKPRNCDERVRCSNCNRVAIRRPL
jgi:hypothetical protein